MPQRPVPKYRHSDMGLERKMPARSEFSKQGRNWIDNYHVKGAGAPPREGFGWATVLVVDDHGPNVMLLERLLNKMGIGRVIGMTDPRLALDLYRSLEPDLLMLDLHMPHLDGFGVLARLSSLNPPDAYVPVVVLTADATDEAKQPALRAGARDFLTKPFDQTEVLLRVRNLLQTRALHLELKRHNAALEAELRDRIEQEQRAARQQAERETRIRSILDGGPLRMVYQPIVRLETGGVIGVEALTRFDMEPVRPPNEWFDEAAAVGMGADLELAAVRAGLAKSHLLPDCAYIALNVSPETLIDPRLVDCLSTQDRPVVVELTEHAAVDSYDVLVGAVGRLRQSGARIAIDDAGAGYASLRHILRVKPDIIKLDVSLTRDIHIDADRRALAASLVTFARETGAQMVAEGIECEEELRTLRGLGVGCGQGFYLAHPAPLPLRTTRFIPMATA